MPRMSKAKLRDRNKYGRLVEDNQAGQVDLTETAAEEVMAAVRAGHQLFVDTLNGADGEMEREVCMAEFTDPHTGKTRWAVESWSGRHKVTRDFGTRQSAVRFRKAELDRLGV